MNGKGDKWRKGTDFKKYRDNWPFGIKPRSPVAPPGHVHTDQKKEDSKKKCRKEVDEE